MPLTSAEAPKLVKEELIHQTSNELTITPTPIEPQHVSMCGGCAEGYVTTPPLFLTCEVTIGGELSC
jgi:hypothetical protein